MHAPNVSEDHIVLDVPAFLVPFRDNSVSTYEFVIERGTGMPVELTLRGPGGEIRQRSVYQDLQINIGVPIQSFNLEDKSEGVRILPREDAEIDVRGFMQQAIFNLLKNAIEASPPPQSRVDMVLRGDADEIKIEVADQGEGLSEGDLDRIFAPFFSTKTRGIGIGLTFAQKIVSLHGGTLIANNNRQGGATFIITLPRCQPSRE